MERYEKKVTINKAIYKKIISDKEIFQLKDISKNEFLTKIIINTMSIQKNRDKIDRIIDILLNKNWQFKNNSLINAINNNINNKLFNNELTDIALKILELDDLQYTSESETIPVNIYESKPNTGEIRNIVENHPSIPASHVLCTIFNTYSSLPLYTRERIVFAKNYNKLLYCKNNNIVCKIKTKYSDEIEFEIYDILQSDEEQHYYVIGNVLVNNKKRLKSFKLSTIERVHNIGKTYIINYPTNIKNAIKGCPQWCGKYINITIKLDKDGIEKFNTIIPNRPKPLKILEEANDHSIMNFFATANHLFAYFVGYGRHFDIISTDIDSINLKNRFKNFYENAYNNLKADS